LKTTSTTKGYIALTATSILWGTTWVASKYAVHDIPGLQLCSIRQFIAGSLFLIFFLVIKKERIPTKKDFKSLFVMALLNFFLANGLSTWGLKYIPTGLAALIGALYPLSVVLIEWIFYKKKNVSSLTFLGLIIGIIGIGYVFSQNMFATITPELFLGLALSIIAMLSWSVGTIFLSKHHLTINSYYGMGWQMIMGSIMLFVFTTITHTNVPYSQISVKGWTAIFYLITAGSITSFIAFIYSLKTLPAAISSLYAYFNPIVAMIVAAIFLKEQLTLSILFGTIITLIGVYIVNKSVKKEIKV